MPDQSRTVTPELQKLGVTALHHIAIAVAHLDAARDVYVEAYGAAVEIAAELPDQGVVAVALSVAGACIELVSPLDGGSGVARFIRERGQGLHHIAWETPDLDATIAAAQAAGWTLTSPQPHVGLHGTRVAFVHPKSHFGVLVEFVEAQSEQSEENQ